MPFHGYQGRTQFAVYWARVGSDRFGQPTVSDVALEVMVRWDGQTRTVFGPNGDPITLDATIGGWTFDPAIGSMVWPGRLDDLPGTGQRPTTDLFRIVGVNVTPDVRGRSQYREANAVRISDELQTTVTVS